MAALSPAPSCERLKSEYGRLLKPFVVLSLLHMLALTALIRANFNYIDDLGRVAEGYRGWDDFGRHISNWLSVLVHGGMEITDISPLPQLLAAVLAALAGCVVLHRFADGRISLWSVAAVLPMGLSPYFLECLSYKFDSLWMALALLGSVMPLLFIESRLRTFVASAVAGTLVMCMTYQAFSGIVVMAAAMHLAKRWSEGEATGGVLARLLAAVAAFVLTTLFYKTFLVADVHYYVDTGIATLPQMIRNVSQFLCRVGEDAAPSWKVMAAVLGLGFACSLAGRSARPRWLVLLLAIPFLAGCGVASYGAYIALQTPLYHPRALAGFGVFAAIAAVVAVNGGWRGAWVARLAAAALAWSLLVFALTYGNALAEQKRYTDFRVQLAIADLTRVVPADADGPALEVQLDGNIGKSPVIRRVEVKYPVLARLVPSTVGGEWNWNTCCFFNYFALPNVRQVNPLLTPGADLRELDLPAVYRSRYHEIRSDRRHVVLRFL